MLPQSFEHAAGYFLRSCELGFELGCGNAAIQWLFFDGEAGLGSGGIQRIRAWLESACAGGDGQACYLQGTAHERGGPDGPDPARAATLFKTACDLGWPAGCSSMAKAYFRGEGVAIDYPTTARGYETACDAGEAASCASLAMMYRDGMGVEADEQHAISLVRRVCDLGLTRLCDAAESLENQ